MSKANVVRAVERIAERITAAGSSELEVAIVGNTPTEVESYIQRAYELSLKQDMGGTKRAIRDANKAGMVEELCIPGMERGAFPLGIHVQRDGKNEIIHHKLATLEEIESEIKACRRENKAEDGRIAQWEETAKAVREHPESQSGLPLGEVLAAIETRQLARNN